MRLRGFIPGVGLVLTLAIVIAAVLVVQGDKAPDRPTASSASPGPVATSPYDFTEADTPVDFMKFGEAKFISLTLETPTGLKSYLLARPSAGFDTLTAALATAQEAPAPEPVTTGGPAATGGPVTADGSAASAGPASSGTTPDEIRPSLTVVMADRTTFTFMLDLADGLLVRNGRAWKLEGDLKTLVESVSE